MTAKDVWDAVNELDGKDMDKGTRMTLEALVKDGEEMSKRMSSLESKVDKLDGSINELKSLIEASINQRQSFWKFLGDLIKETRFWVWIIILTVLAYGVSITDLKGLLQ